MKKANIIQGLIWLGMFLLGFGTTFLLEKGSDTEPQAFASVGIASLSEEGVPGIYRVAACFVRTVQRDGLPSYEDTFCPEPVTMAAPHIDSLKAWITPPAFAKDAALLDFTSVRVIRYPIPPKEPSQELPNPKEETGPIKPFPTK